MEKDKLYLINKIKLYNNHKTVFLFCRIIKKKAIFKKKLKMNLSYWELKNWFANVDFTIVGSGIVGLHCALALCEKYPESKYLYNVCVKIPFDKIIQRKDDTLQINWFASRVKDSVVPCG